jgi:hypothetical protein
VHTSFLVLPNYPVEFRLLWSLVDDDNDKPVIIQATEAISKSFGQYLSDTPAMHEIKELQKKQPHWSLYTYCRKC